MILSIAKYPPHHCGDIQILRDKITAFFDMRVNWWQCCINGNIKAGKDADSFQALLSEISAEISSKSRAGTKRKAVIFINDLDCTRMILPDGQKTTAKKVKAGIEYSMEYDTDSIIFRNFNILFNNKTEKVMKMFPGYPCCVAMQKFLDMFDLPLTDLRYSLAYLTKKTFYKDIKSDLWENTRMHRRILRDRATYNDMQAGNQGGMLTSFSGDNCILFQILKNVASFDKKSAYPSYFITDRYFPVGKVIRVTGAENYRKLQLADAIRKKQWFKIVIECELSDPEMQIFKTPGAGLYGIEFWDYRVLQKCGIDIFALLTGKKWRLYRCTFTGYMPDVFRRKVIQLYERKNAIEDKNDPERFLIKTQLDMLYGKGLQKYDFATDQDVFKKYVLRGENFLLPQMSMHVVAAMRHELLTVAGYFGADCFAYDTDGVKIRLDDPGQLDKESEFFAKINGYIMDKNKAAGFVSDIGIWDHEYTARRFIQFAPKVYAYEDSSGKVTCKFAGVAERYTKKYLGDKTPDEIFDMWERHGLDLQTCAGWMYVPEKKWFIELKNDYKILKEC